MNSSLVLQPFSVALWLLWGALHAMGGHKKKKQKRTHSCSKERVDVCLLLMECEFCLLCCFVAWMLVALLHVVLVALPGAAQDPGQHLLSSLNSSGCTNLNLLASCSQTSNLLASWLGWLKQMKVKVGGS